MDESKLAKVLIPTPYGRMEKVWAEALGQGLFRLRNSLFFGYGMSLHDVVETRSSGPGELPTVTGVRTRSGNRTIRIHVPFGLESSRGEKLIAELKALGCSYEGAKDIVISLTIPAAVALHDVTSYLVENAMEWEMVDPPPRTDTTRG